MIAKRSYALGPLSSLRAQYQLGAAAQVHDRKPVGRAGAAIGNAFRNHWIVAAYLVGMGLLFGFGG